MREITGKELIEMSDRAEVKIIDIRQVDAYNGWPLRGEKRGGHISNARSLPAKWADYIDWIEIVRHKDILPNHTIIIYGYDRADIEKATGRFLKAGYYNILHYFGFVEEWSANDRFPMNRMERYKNLVPAGWLQSLISGKRTDGYDNERYVIVHAHYRNRNAYLSGHIPGAIDMDTLSLEAPETWNRRSPEELKESFENHGITSDTTVIVYGKYMSPDKHDPFPGSAAGDIGAMRCAFIMLYAGVKDVRVLNGGFQAWEDSGFVVSFADVPKNRVPDFGSLIPARPELIVDTPEAKRMIVSSDSDLVCVRSRTEYTGEESGYNYIEKKGRIPGAIFADCGSDAYHMENYRNVDQTTREFPEISKIWRNSGITPDKHLAFYCGTGWRGSEAFMNAWLMGYPRISVYDGGWFEWSSDPANPYETGVPDLKVANT
jgi:thiosulfate/3-mercaptopyruvate sulfurtransferase